MAENHPANALFRSWFDLRVNEMELKKDLALFQAAWGALNGQTAPFAGYRFEKRRGQLSPFQLARLDEPFRRRVSFMPTKPITWPARMFARVPNVDLATKLETDPDAALLALHAPDGRLRKRAVQTAPMNDTAAVTALLLRCNDWAAPVRDAAFKRLETVLGGLDQRALAPLSLFVLDRSVRWRRGGAKVLERMSAHPAWPSAVKAMLMTTTNGPLAKTLRQLLRHPEFDWALPELAMSASSAFVRAVATETLLDEAARWLDGHEWVWHDKVFNLRRKVNLYAKRQVVVTDETKRLVLRSACFDKSAKVRCLAADFFIKEGPPSEAGLLALLHHDKAKTVQERMAYFEKKWVRNPSTQERVRQ